MAHDRIHFVTANYYQLQGLRLVPLGLFLVGLGVSVAGWLSWVPGDSPHAEQRALALAFCFAGLAGAVATAYYRCRFGSLAQFGRAGRNWWIAGAILLFLLGAKLDQRMQAPIALAPLWMAAVLMLVVRVDGWLRRHFLVAAAPWLVVALLPALHQGADTRVGAYALAGGLTLMICGIGDHQLIVQTLIERRDVFGGANSRIV